MRHVDIPQVRKSLRKRGGEGVQPKKGKLRTAA
jgi:hypothetical protein